jgi:predicted DNA-binding transcriptional regulator YafY
VSRAARLLTLLEILRKRRSVVTGAELAEATGVSLRTLYRDIDALREQGVTVEGEAGTGYRVVPGWVLPPLMFDEDELEALLLGIRWVSRRTDPALEKSAKSALDKIEAVLPRDLRHVFEQSALLVGPSERDPGVVLDLSLVRSAIRDRRRVELRYRDAKGEATSRVVWPVALGFFESARMLAGWCELRQDFRHFRLDRVQSWTALADRYPGSRSALFERWRKSIGSDP